MGRGGLKGRGMVGRWLDPTHRPLSSPDRGIHSPGRRFFLPPPPDSASEFQRYSVPASRTPFWLGMRPHRPVQWPRR
jgi:hypothetical protein